MNKRRWDVAWLAECWILGLLVVVAALALVWGWR